MKFIIQDSKDQDGCAGYVWNSPNEGWCFNLLITMATTFESVEEAQKCIDQHYCHLKGLSIIKI